MEKTFEELLKDLDNISPMKIANIIETKRDQGYKIKNSHSLPSLRRAVMIEDELNIPASFWIRLKAHREKESLIEVSK